MLCSSLRSDGDLAVRRLGRTESEVVEEVSRRLEVRREGSRIVGGEVEEGRSKRIAEDQDATESCRRSDATVPVEPPSPPVPDAALVVQTTSSPTILTCLLGTCWTSFLHLGPDD